MNAAQFLRSWVIRTFSSGSIRERKRALYRLKHKLSGAAHRVEYFHQLDDPYSHLAVQTLSKLSLSYDIELIIHLVDRPNAVDAPEPKMLDDYARVDAANIAPFYGLQFKDPGAQPHRELITLAQRVLRGAISKGNFANLAVKVGDALWRGDGGALESMAVNCSPTKLEGELRKAEKRRDSLGHYLGGTFYYDGEWYWGVDRLNYLEQRLQLMGLASGPQIIKRPQIQGYKAKNRTDITLEYFPSLRSPYTYISMAAVYQLAQRTGVKLVMRPVLPMMMRGVPASMNKGKYIFSDCKREAEQVFDVPFGNICDPFGEPVKRGYSLFQWAQSKGRSQELFLSFTTAAFAKRIDTGTDKGMQYVVENAGLNWQEAKADIDNKEWESVLEQNRLDLYDMGIWGVPSFRLSGGSISEPSAVWGADRLWLLEANIKRRASTTAEVANP